MRSVPSRRKGPHSVNCSGALTSPHPRGRQRLDLRQRKFVAEYLRDSNATRAAKAAGYSARTAHVQGCQLLIKLKSEIEEAENRIARCIEVKAERVLREVALIAFANMQDYMSFENGVPHFDFSKIHGAVGAAIAQITIDEFTDERGESARQVRRVRFKLHPKTQALELLGKHLKLWTDRLDPAGGEDPITALIAEFRLRRGVNTENVLDAQAFGNGASGETKSSLPGE